MTAHTSSTVNEPGPSDIDYTFHPQRFDGSQPQRSKGWRGSVPSLDPATSSDRQFFVDPIQGNDASPGSQDKPLKTIAAAVAKAEAAAKAADVAKDMAKSESPPQNTTILLRAGTHQVAKTISITTSSLTIQPFNKEEVVISGGVRLAPQWKKVAPMAGSAANPAVVDTYAASVPTGLRFMELFNATTARLVPARSPNGNPEVDQNNFQLRGKETSCKDFGPCTAVVVNDTCSGCVDPRKGQFASYSMGVGGPADNFVPAISYWAQPHPRGGGGATYTIPNGVHTDDNPGRLLDGGGGYVFMMQTHTWGSWVYEIADVAVNAVGAKNATNITFGAGGFQEARGGSGGCGTGNFYVSHRREALDQAGEWYLDEKTSMLYTVVASGAAPPATVFAPQVDVLFSVEGTQAKPVSGFRLSSVTLRHTAPTYMSNYRYKHEMCMVSCIHTSICRRYTRNTALTIHAFHASNTPSTALVPAATTQCTAQEPSRSSGRRARPSTIACSTASGATACGCTRTTARR